MRKSLLPVTGALDFGADPLQFLFEPLVAAVEMVDAVHLRLPFGGFGASSSEGFALALVFSLRCGFGGGCHARFSDAREGLDSRRRGGGGGAAAPAARNELFQLASAPPRRKASISSAVAVRPLGPKPSSSFPVFAALRP